MNHQGPAYGLWALVLINSAVFILFAYSFAIRGNPHFDPLHIHSIILILAGFLILYSAWKVLYAAQRERRLATTGAYARVRHPQYAGFTLIMFGFLFQWPTLLTLPMFPVLVYMYHRLALRDERDSREAFGAAWDDYAARTPRFFPRFGASPAKTSGVRRERRDVPWR